jgi:RimJ/RimL family protein N-acetyltransferase
MGPASSRAGRIPALDPPPSDGVVALRPWREADVPAMTAAGRDPEIQRWTMVPDGYAEEQARGFVAHTEAARDAAESLELAVVDAASDADVLGAVGLVTIDWDRECAEVGYWTAPQARRRGIAVRAVRVLSAWAFAQLGLARLELTPFAGNGPSERVAERAGYTREGVLRSSYRSKTGLVDVVMYSLLRDDPAAQSATRSSAS